jgi:hypothetical protein
MVSFCNGLDLRNRIKSAALLIKIGCNLIENKKNMNLKWHVVAVHKVLMIMHGN